VNSNYHLLSCSNSKGDEKTQTDWSRWTSNRGLCVCVCVCVCACVCVQLGHFGCLSNKPMEHDKETEKVCNLSFSSSWDTTGFYFLSAECVWDSQTTVRVYHWERPLGIWAWSSCWCLLFLMCALCSKQGSRIRNNLLSIYSVGPLLVCMLYKSTCMCVGLCVCVGVYVWADTMSRSDYGYWLVHLWVRKAEKMGAMGVIWTPVMSSTSSRDL